ncbi:MAG: mechanosensitive ion channel family protein [Halobacteria archaeon]
MANTSGSNVTGRARSFSGDLIDVMEAWAIEYLPEYITAAIIVLIGYWLSGVVAKYLARPIYKWVQRPSVAKTIIRSIRYVIIIFSFLFAARVAFGLSLTSFALTATVFSAVIGVVLAPIIGDIVSGLFVIGDQPYDIGDMIEIVDTSEKGFVEDVTLRYTKVFTLENTFLVIPNSEIRKRDVINYSAEDMRTREEIDLSITYESDVDVARELMVEAAREIPEIIHTAGEIRIGNARYNLEPHTLITDFGDHGIGLRLRYWLREPYHSVPIESDVYTKIWRKFNQNEIKIPYPHRHHIFDQTSGDLGVDLEGESAPDPRDLKRKTDGDYDPEPDQG